MLAHELAHVKRKPATVVAEASGGRTHRRHRETPPAGFEDRDNHRIVCASILYLQLLTNNVTKDYSTITAQYAALLFGGGPARGHNQQGHIYEASSASTFVIGARRL